MQTNVVQVRGITFIGKAASGHWVTMDGPADFAGSNAATRPKELILIGLGGCTGADVASILQKMREKVSRFEIDIDAESAKEHPKVFTSARIDYIVTGHGVNEAAVKRAIELSAVRYCPAQAMLAKVFPMELHYQIFEAGDDGAKLVVEGQWKPPQD